jgi:hypothetical protein
MNSSTGPLVSQLKAPAGTCIVFMPGTAGEVLKTNSTVRSPLDKVTFSAGIPFTVKSLASRVAGSTGSLTSRVKETGSTEMIAPQVKKGRVVTEQGAAVSEATPINVIVARLMLWLASYLHSTSIKRRQL